MNLPTKQNRITDIKTNLWLTEGGGINWNIGTDKYTLYKHITNKNLLYSAGNSTQYSVITYIGKESKKSGISFFVGITDSLWYT